MVVLARKRCKVGLVANATDRLPQDLKALGLCEHLDFVINSSEVGFAKPSPEIFKRALAVAGVQPFEAVFIDDTTSNISAAAALGIQAHHFASVAGLTTFLRTVGLVTDAA